MTSAKATITPGHKDPEVVKKAEAVFSKMGMTPQEAIALFYKQTALRGDFPITELLINEDTREAVDSARSGREVSKYGSVAEVMAEYRHARTSPDDEV